MREGKMVLIFMFAVLIGSAVLYLQPMPLSAQEVASDIEKSKMAASTKPAVQAAPKAFVSKEDVGKKVKMVTKTLSGKIGARGPNGIAVVYEKDEAKRSSKEMWFPYEGEVRLTGYETKADIGEEDLVTVTYNEAEDGSKRVLTGIKLDKKYEPPPEEEEADEEEEGNE